MLIFISMKLTILFSFLFLNICYGKYVSLGTFVPYFNKEQVNNEGDKKIFELNPYIGIGNNFPLVANHFFVPELAYTYMMSSEDDVREEIIFLNYHFARPITTNFILRYGLTTHWWRIVGKGGRMRLRNGNGYTKFKLPNKTQTSYITSLMLGFENFIDNEKSFRFDLNLMDSINSESRTYNYLLTVNLFI